MSSQTPKRWSQQVTMRSNALDLEKSVFTWRNPKKIAQSLKASAIKSKRRKGTTYQSAMSMFNFYINRAGKHLNRFHKKILYRAKQELRTLFHREK